MKKIIVNHKSYMSYSEIIKYKEELERINVNKYEIVLFPNILYLSMFKDCKYLIGSQNIYGRTYGNYTGEINIESLKEIGVSYVLVNHPERIINQLDNKRIIKEKLDVSLNSHFNTIFVVGENKYMKDAFKYIKNELNYYLKDIKNVDNLSILYEPSWLGDKTPEINNIRKIVIDIKEYFINKYKKEVEVYYGGGVNLKNYKEILEITDGIGIGKSGTVIKNLEEFVKE